MKRIICLLIIISTIFCTPVVTFAIDHCDPDSIEPGVTVMMNYNDFN